MCRSCNRPPGHPNCRPLCLGQGRRTPFVSGPLGAVHPNHIGHQIDFLFPDPCRSSVRVGEYDTSSDPDCANTGFCAPRSVNHAISHVIVHPDYKQGQYHHDIALLVLKTPLNYSGEFWAGWGRYQSTHINIGVQRWLRLAVSALIKNRFVLSSFQPPHSLQVHKCQMYRLPCMSLIRGWDPHISSHLIGRRWALVRVYCTS